MKVMVDRYNEATTKIKTLEELLKQKEADNSMLVARIVDAYERTTLKTRYDLLKEYKKGLLVDADVEEEIELFEDPLPKPKIHRHPLLLQPCRHRTSMNPLLSNLLAMWILRKFVRSSSSFFFFTSNCKQ